MDSPAATCRRGSKKAQLATAMASHSEKKKTTAPCWRRVLSFPVGKLSASCSKGGWYIKVRVTPAVKAKGSLERRRPAASQSQPARTSRNPGLPLGWLRHAATPERTRPSPTARNIPNSRRLKGALSAIPPRCSR